MAYTITDRCQSSGTCAEVCPTDAIIKDDQTNQFRILEEECIECGDCAEICPHQAIVSPDDVLLVE